MEKLSESEPSEKIAKLSEFVPVALNFAQLDLEHDVTRAWTSQVAQLRELSEVEEDDLMDFDDFSIPQQPCTQGKNAEHKYAKCRIGRDKLEKSKVPIIPIPVVNKAPMMKFWTVVESNVRVKSRYTNNQDGDALSDEDDDEVRNFIKSSVQNASTEVNMSSKSPASALKDDQLFINFVKTMLDYEKAECRVTSTDIPKDTFVGSNVFHAVSEACPGLGFPFQLRDRYAWLTRNETQSQRNRSTVVSRSEVLHFYHQNFCRRCLMYNCLLHGKEERVDVRSAVTSPDFEKEVEPCGRSCYMLLRGEDSHSDISDEYSNVEFQAQEDAKVVEEDSHVSGYASMIHVDTSSSDDDVISIEDDSGSDDSIVIVGSNLTNNVQPKSFVNKCAVEDVSSNKLNQYQEILAEVSSSEGHQPNDAEYQMTSTSEEARAQDVHSLLFEDRNHLDENKPDIPELLKEWSDDELSMYSAIQIVWQNNFCELARVIRTKTCFEVYQLSREKSLHSADDQSPRTGHAPKNKKKRVQDRVAKVWFNHCKQYNLILARKHKDKPANQPVYTPCNHPNRPCDLSTCCCLQKHIPCEKFCSCFHDEVACHNLYPGCQCQGACNSNTCQCYIALRECDVDLCSCGLEKILLQDIKDLTCKNISIQMRQGKKVRKGISKVSGWGLFAGEPIKKFDFVGEYVGEIISYPESERRGEKYDRMKYTFLFTKDEENCIDGMYFGNLTRFINSSSNPNCYPLIKSVYGNLRIGMYANKNIAQGEELLFDYMKAIKQQMKNVDLSLEASSETKIPMKTIQNPNFSSEFMSYNNKSSTETEGTKAIMASKSVDKYQGDL